LAIRVTRRVCKKKSPKILLNPFFCQNQYILFLEKSSPRICATSENFQKLPP
jgi:hypothetical protein